MFLKGSIAEASPRPRHGISLAPLLRHITAEH
jgi:hypothetical protein